MKTFHALITELKEALDPKKPLFYTKPSQTSRPTTDPSKGKSVQATGPVTATPTQRLFKAVQAAPDHSATINKLKAQRDPEAASAAAIARGSGTRQVSSRGTVPGSKPHDLVGRHGAAKCPHCETRNVAKLDGASNKGGEWAASSARGFEGSTHQCHSCSTQWHEGRRKELEGEQTKRTKEQGIDVKLFNHDPHRKGGDDSYGIGPREPKAAAREREQAGKSTPSVDLPKSHHNAAMAKLQVTDAPGKGVATGDNVEHPANHVTRATPVRGTAGDLKVEPHTPSVKTAPKVKAQDKPNTGNYSVGSARTGLSGFAAVTGNARKQGMGKALDTKVTSLKTDKFVPPKSVKNAVDSDNKPKAVDASSVKPGYRGELKARPHKGNF